MVLHVFTIVLYFFRLSLDTQVNLAVQQITVRRNATPSKAKFEGKAVRTRWRAARPAATALRQGFWTVLNGTIGDPLFSFVQPAISCLIFLNHLGWWNLSHTAQLQLLNCSISISMYLNVSPTTSRSQLESAQGHTLRVLPSNRDIFSVQPKVHLLPHWGNPGAVAKPTLRPTLCISILRTRENLLYKDNLKPIFQPWRRRKLTSSNRSLVLAPAACKSNSQAAQAV